MNCAIHYRLQGANREATPVSLNITLVSLNITQRSQPRSQGFSSSPSSLAPEGGKMRDPGNDVTA